MKWSRVAAVAVVATALFASDFSIRATTMVPFSNEDLSLLSDAVVVGRVESVDPVRNAQTGMIYTDITLDVEEVWKGELKAPTYLTVRTLGGSKDGVTARVASVPVFLRNERTLLYLEYNPAKHQWGVLGWNQGKLTVFDEEDGTRKAKRVPLKLEHSGLDIDAAEVQQVMQRGEKAVQLGDLRTVLEHTLADFAAKGGGDPWKLDKYQGIGR